VTAAVSVTSSPVGLIVNIDGQPKRTQSTFTGVAGVQRLLTAPTSQTLNGKTWVFDNWSDGGAREHTITTPSVNTTISAVYRLNAGTVGTGTGLSATYFNNADFTGTTVKRTDRSLNFRWGNGSPASSIGGDTFSARWTGQIASQFTETYTFSAFSDDGVRVWVNGVRIIDAFSKTTASTNTASATMTAGQRVPIVIEYVERVGGATMQLSWSSARTPLSIIPGTQFYPTTSLKAVSLAPTITTAKVAAFSTSVMPIKDDLLERNAGPLV